MSKHALLNNIDHKDLRVITTRSAELGDNVMLALTFPSEFRDLQAHYPIVFRKNAQGQFESVALLGFKDGQNLFLSRDGWDATYIPLTIERQPFLIGFDANREPMMHIDLDHPRVNRDAGEPLFREFGGNTEFLERMNSVLLAIHQGMADNETFIGTLLQFELLESFVFDIQLNDGSNNRLAGFYTLHEERLRGLSGAVLERLSRTGHLQAMYMQLASLSQFRALIGRMNKLNAGNR